MLAQTHDPLTRAKAALAKSTIRDLRRLRIRKDEDRILIHGRLSSFYHLQLAQELLRNEIGDAQLVANVQVA
jgi:hypothetical protein